MRIRCNATLPPSLIAAAVLAACSDIPTQENCAEGPARSRANVSVSEHISDERLKAMYLHCSRAALHHRIGINSIAACSVIYETLLQQVFDGDFHALLAWSRKHRHDQEVVDPIGPIDRSL